jgi:hypothetical protein
MHGVILPALERCLLEIAIAQGCRVEDLSFALFRALEAYGVECIRAAEQATAHERGPVSGVMRRVGPEIRSIKPRKRAVAK